MRPALLACLLASTLPSLAGAAVQVMVGPTPIRGGDAKSAGDITVVNEKLAFALAIGSAVPYGVDFVFFPNSDVGEYCPFVSP